MASSQGSAVSGPPYPPQHANLGGVPTPSLDIPPSAVFFVLFLFTGIAHATLFAKNKSKGHYFPFSGAMTAFCVIRVISTALRMSWAKNQHNIRLAIAASVFLSAGTVILFIVNIFLTQRLMRARHPHIGWHRAFVIPQVVLFLVLASLVMLISAVIDSFYTLNKNTLRIERDIQLFGLTMFATMAFLPIPIILFILALPPRTTLDKFGTGRFGVKCGLVLASSTILTLGASYRAGVNFLTPIPVTESVWYYSKACFYLFNLTIDFIAVFGYLVARVDLLFHVKDKARGPGSYSGDNTPAQGPRDNVEWPRDEQHEKGEENGGEDGGENGGAPVGDRAVLELNATSGGWTARRMSDVSAESNSKEKT